MYMYYYTHLLVIMGLHNMFRENLNLFSTFCSQ